MAAADRVGHLGAEALVRALRPPRRGPAHRQVEIEAARIVPLLGGRQHFPLDPVGDPLGIGHDAALAHGANHLATLVRDAVDALEHAGVVPAERLLGPLLEAALDNTLRHGDRALTGPVARGDLETVRLHLRVLAESAPDLLDPYRAQAARTADRAEAAGLLEPAVAVQIRDMLREGR